MSANPVMDVASLPMTAQKRHLQLLAPAETEAPLRFGIRERRLPKLPLWSLLTLAAWLLLYAVGARSQAWSMLTPLARHTLFALCATAGLISACRFACWLDAVVYSKLRDSPADRRIVLLLATPFAVAWVAMPLLWAIDAALAQGGYDATLLLTAGVALTWYGAASLGSALFVMLDLATSAVFTTFRARLHALGVAMLSLSACAAVLLGPRLFALLNPEARDAFIAPRLLSAGPLPLLLRSSVAFVLAVTAVTALPAVMSATSKLVRLVMERIYPLMKALDAVADGKRDVRVATNGAEEFSRLGKHFNRMVDRLALAERMEHAFGMYVSTHVLDRIRAQHGEATLPASVREASVLFADIRGFTAMSEQLPPEQVVDILNTFFAHAVEVIDAHDGYLNKFVGDCLMVVFNGPLEQPDHATRAVRCAQALQAAVGQLNATRAFVHVDEIQIGVGIASGPMICGNVGSPRQMEYTVIGDVVNTASRLCGLAQAGEVWLTKKTASQLPEEMSTRELPPVTVKGKRDPIEVACA